MLFAKAKKSSHSGKPDFVHRASSHLHFGLDLEHQLDLEPFSACFSARNHFRVSRKNSLRRHPLGLLKLEVFEWSWGSQCLLAPKAFSVAKGIPELLRVPGAMGFSENPTIFRVFELGFQGRWRLSAPGNDWKRPERHGKRPCSVAYLAMGSLPKDAAQRVADPTAA